MNILKSLNLLVRFLLELCMLAALGYWGFKTQSGWVMKIIIGIGLPILIAVIWGLFLAPRATYPLQGVS
ncbi:MAG TPA: YrdB family protein, partial [Anaerolineales bacterium]|nr:YrdB family protein [Anaerolineales bacterium]